MSRSELSRVVTYAPLWGPSAVTKIVKELARPGRNVSDVGSDEDIAKALNILRQDPTGVKEALSKLSSEHRQFLNSILDRYGTDEDKTVLCEVIKADSAVTIEIVKALKFVAGMVTLGAAYVAVAAITRPPTLNEQIFGRRRRR